MPRPKTLDPCSVGGCDGKVIAWGWCEMHYRRWKKNGDPETRTGVVRPSSEERFFALADQHGPEPGLDTLAAGLSPCWLWTGWKTSRGYGGFWDAGSKIVAHVWAYRHFVGDYDPTLDLDHLCRVRACVNPEHLEPVTRGENLRRGNIGNNSPVIRANREKTHCYRGHPFSEENTYHEAGHRVCRECRRLKRRIKYRKARGLPGEGTQRVTTV